MCESEPKLSPFHQLTDVTCSETTSIPTNPRTTRPVGYAFIDLSTSSEAERAIQDLNGKTILDRKVSVQLARTPEPATEGKEGEPRRRSSARGRGRGRGGRAARGGRGVRYHLNEFGKGAKLADITCTGQEGCQW